MKVLGVLLLAVATVSCGSGPYLPSGWRPEGPAFLLPTEVQKPEAGPQDTNTKVALSTTDKPVENPQDALEESEASGSDFLREYGPPNLDILKAITVQALPDLTTKKTFAVIETAISQESSVESDSSKEKVEKIAITNEEPVPSIVGIGTTEEDNVSISTITTEEGLEISTTEALPAEEIAEVTTVSNGNSISDEETTTQPIGETTQSAVTEVERNDEESNATVKTDDESRSIASGSLEYLPPSVDELEENAKDGIFNGNSILDEETTAQPIFETTQYAVTEIESNDEESNVTVKTDDESKSIASGSLKYLPPSVNKLEKIAKDGLLLKNNPTSIQEDNSNLEPPVQVANENEEATPLFKAKLATESQPDDDANVENFPPTIQTNEDSSSRNELSEVEINIVKETVEDKQVVSEDKIEESSGLGPREEERIGFREYGPPKVANAEKSEKERIENNETRKRRFSLKFSPKRTN